MTKKVEKFYKQALKSLKSSNIPFMVGGTFAFTEYTGIQRPTKDLDIFCKAGDYPRLLKFLSDAGYEIEVTDERWLAKVFQPTSPKNKDLVKKDFIDIIFGSRTGQAYVDDLWFETAPVRNIFGQDLKLIPPEELIWSKSYRQTREKYDGADVHHMFLKCGKDLDWKRLLNHMEHTWEILFAHVINFRYAYPADREIIPRWLLDEFISRMKHQLEMPIPKDKVCRGRFLSPDQYEYAFSEWGYKDFGTT